MTDTGPAGLGTALSERFGMEHAVFGFTHCREVCAAVSRGGGMGVYGAAYFTPEQVEVDVAWIRDHVDGRPFGVDVMFPRTGELSTADEIAAMARELTARIPDGHRAFVEELLDAFAVPHLPGGVPSTPAFALGPSAQAARRHLDSAIELGAALVVSALGPPPAETVTAAHAHGVAVGGMVGSVRHVAHHLDAGVDLVIAQGSEAAAHAGDISTMVLVPEVVDACGDVPVLAAGGIATGRQVLAAMALGAHGVWTGSMWRTAAECTEPDGVVALLLEAGSGDTVRSRCMTGKALRQLRSPWNAAWEHPEAPDPLPMPLQRMLVAEAESRIEAAGRDDLVVSPIGQVVGQLRERRTVARLLDDLVAGYASAHAALGSR